ncbi:hypothetical protein [Bradyrhizobium sp. 1]|uniref:hypothetical protein n=1 Tax=Bradyrhizobium sp. 1 TaxID=241591 RepID=UPI001FF8E3CC|nr:hypothetical protein [Bradyrhizobium sp. 1]MCK1393474.1 hypothetical protein [Bradyrhizobium sp. 1]
MVDMDDEAVRMTDLLRGKAVKVIKRHRTQEVMIEFEDGIRLYVDRTGEGLEFSITEGRTAE